MLQSLFFSPGGHRTEVLVEYGEHGSIWEELWLVNLPDLDPSGFTLGCASDLTCLSPCRGRRGGTRPGCLTRCYFAPKTKEPSRVALPWWPTGRWRGRRRGRAPQGGELLQARAELGLLSAETSDQNLGQKVTFCFALQIWGVFTVFTTESLISDSGCGIHWTFGQQLKVKKTYLFRCGRYTKCTNVYPIPDLHNWNITERMHPKAMTFHLFSIWACSPCLQKSNAGDLNESAIPSFMEGKLGCAARDAGWIFQNPNIEMPWELKLDFSQNIVTSRVGR